MASGSPAQALPIDKQNIRRAPSLSARLRTQEGIAALLTVVLLIVINGIILFNVATDAFIVGYDTKWHIVYSEVLSTGRLVEERETPMFFSPPLPYLLPAIANRIAPSAEIVGKVGQLENFFLSVGLTLLIVSMARRLSPDQPFHAPMALLVLGIMPVYYKSFAFFRGEPMMAFFLVLATWWLYRSKATVRDAALLGLFVGLGGLSRQWPIVAIPAFALYAVLARGWRFKHLVVAGVVVAVVAGWFYFSLWHRYGTPLAFDRGPSKGSPALQLFIGTGNGQLFTNPTRTMFDNQSLPIMYSDTWGDYWLFWVGDRKAGIDPAWIPVLARMNVVNLLPTAAIVVGLIAGLRQRKYSLLYLLLAISFVGFLALQIRFNNAQGDNLKGTYVLQMYPLVAVIVGGWLARYWRIALVVGVLLLIHNRPLFAYGGSLLPPG